jgi:hypothetical protein
MVIICVGKAIMSVARDLAYCDLALVEDVAARALALTTTFHLPASTLSDRASDPLKRLITASAGKPQGPSGLP